MGAFWAGAGAAATNLVAGYLPLGGGGWMDVIKQGLAAYVVSFIAERVPFIGHANAQLMGIGGFAGTAWSAANMLLSGASGFLTPHPQPTAAPGMSGYFGDISTYPPGALNGLGEIVQAPEWYNNAGMVNG